MNVTKNDFENRFIPEPNSGCWLWLEHIHRLGYGRVRWGGRSRQAHSVAYELYIGPIPQGLELDHLCKTRCCVNPDHLEPVTHAENVRRGTSPSAIHGRKTHCVNGHEFSVDNTYVWANKMRTCRACKNSRERRYRRNK